MKNNLTELVFILDRSGSMAGLENDTIGGFNSFIKKQKAEHGEANLTTILFDDKYELLHNRADIKTINPLTKDDYFVRGSTALLDAIGRAIDTLGAKLNDEAEENRPSKVLFAITTDGMENASREYSAKKVREMIQHQKSKYSWEFLFLGANIDAIKTAEDIGIEADRATNFCCDVPGVRLSYEGLNKAVAGLRQSRIDDSWKDEIESDHKKRGKKK